MLGLILLSFSVYSEGTTKFQEIQARLVSIRENLENISNNIEFKIQNGNKPVTKVKLQEFNNKRLNYIQKALKQQKTIENLQFNLVYVPFHLVSILKKYSPNSPNFIDQI